MSGLIPLMIILFRELLIHFLLISLNSTLRFHVLMMIVEIISMWLFYWFLFGFFRNNIGCNEIILVIFFNIFGTISIHRRILQIWLTVLLDFLSWWFILLRIQLIDNWLDFRYEFLLPVFFDIFFEGYRNFHNTLIIMRYLFISYPVFSVRKAITKFNQIVNDNQWILSGQIMAKFMVFFWQHEFILFCLFQVF